MKKILLLALTAILLASCATPVTLGERYAAMYEEKPLITAINTAATDKVVAGRKCNAFVLSDLPAGKYSSMYEKDATLPAGKPYVKATVK